MRNMLCLTVYECKGLEFDEVILFNFFQDSKCDNQWKLLNDVIAEQKVVKKQGVADFLDFEMLDVKEALDEDEPLKDEEVKKAVAVLPEGQTMIDTTGGKKTQSSVDAGQIAQTRVDGDHEVETVLTL